MNDSLFGKRDFVLHWASTAIAQVGSFFSFVALPWLALNLTENDPVIMAAVMALVSLPQGLFILFGGALADRLSPLRVLLVTRGLFFILMLSMAVLVYYESFPLWALFLYSPALGILGGFSVPAAQSVLPSLIPSVMLGRANAMVVATTQLAQTLGPMLGGWLIWFTQQTVSEQSGKHAGLAMAFAVDAFTLLVSLMFMQFMRAAPAAQTSCTHGLWEMFYDGVRFCWSDHAMRVVLGYLVLISFCLHGPLMTSIPIFIKVDLGLEAEAYGTLYAMIGLGTLTGAGFAFSRKFTNSQMGLLVLCCDLGAGAALFFLGNQTNPWVAAIFLILIGFCIGTMMVAGTTWFQLRTPGAYMGRVMSLLMFAIAGLIPVSTGITGYLIELYSSGTAMNIAGALMITFAAVGLATPYIRNMGLLPGPAIQPTTQEVHAQ
ncbi:MFS transporter [Microbulbifer sp. SH-1]|uniref:MFS transporter n=1 Tax=Microbulbifer sp. SH-1 TaxID=2681547 RepID=UPI00140B8672|nr:MFS transporter [Microbulbifer sp. SH-1]QIL90223.1 MFS transporter [Microbulbifer sp. SH-1]